MKKLNDHLEAIHGHSLQFVSVQHSYSSLSQSSQTGLREGSLGGFSCNFYEADTC